MKLFEELRQDLAVPPAGARAPYYFRYLGYMQDPAAPITTARGNALFSLFTKTTPHVHPHELITGYDYSLWCEADEATLQYADAIDRQYGYRTFGTNADHFTPNYEHTFAVGVPGLLEEIRVSLEKHRDDPEKTETLLAMQRSMQGFFQMIRNYMDCAKSHKGEAGYDDHKLDFIVKNCEVLLTGAPQTFAQALQLLWFCHTAFWMEDRSAMAFGRMDQYLYPFYVKDTQAGILTKEQATELLENVFIKLTGRDTVNICIGGMDMQQKCQVNELSYCIIDAVRNCNVPGPNLSARMTPDAPDEFWDACLKSIGTGLGYPALMNDTVNIPALLDYGYAKEDVYNYSMVGCIENFMSGKQPPWTDGRFDTPRFLDYVFNNGVSEFNHSFGLALGDVSEIKTMQEFMERFEKQLAHGADMYVAATNNTTNSANPKQYKQPFLSCFCYDCIGRGQDINDGGAIYPSVHGAVLMGVGTTSDSLAAIEKVVFIDKEATLTELRDALNANFEGYEELQKKLLAAPKYGNNNDFVDMYAVWFLDYLSALFRPQRTRDGGYFYVAMAANVANIYAGLVINATPDGRKAGEPLSDAASPTYGRDTGGATVTINSVTKPDYTKAACGTVVNQKFSPSMFEDGKREKLIALFKTYFKKGGQEVQINATSREVLKDAMDHPENYQNLVVRVSGFSAFYVTLDRCVQQDILERTQQS